MLTQRICRIKTVKSICVDVSDADPGGFTQGSQPQIDFRFTAFDQPQAFAQDLTCVLITP